MPNKQFSILSDGTTSYDVKDATARTDISTLDAKVDALEVSDLADTNISNPTDGQSLVYDETSGKWINDTGASKEWVGTSAELAQAIEDGDIDDDTNILVTNDYTPGGGSSTSHVIITSAVGSEITVLKPDGVTSIIPTQVASSTTQWECNVSDFGTYTVSIVLGGTTRTQTFNMGAVGQYNVVYDSTENTWKVTIDLVLNYLSNVDINGATNGQVISYDSFNSVWKNSDISVPSDLSDLGDTNISSLANSQILRYDSASQKWINSNESQGGHIMLPTPAAGVSEADIVSAVNTGKTEGGTNDDVASLYTIGTWTNQKSVRRIMSGVQLGTKITSTGIGTWFDGDVSEIVPLTDEADWWYDSAFIVPVSYVLTSDTDIVDGKTYYTRSGSSPNYTYTEVSSPVIADIGIYYELYSDDIDLSIKFDPLGDVVVVGGYILDATTGKLCIKFANEIDINTCRIAVDITYTRNEVG